MMKEGLPLTFVTSDEPEPHDKASSFNHGILTSNYHNIASLRVPIAEAESYFDIRENEEEEEYDLDGEEKYSQVILVTLPFYSMELFSQQHDAVASIGKHR